MVPPKTLSSLLSNSLPTLKAKTLTSLCLAAGIPTTGTKSTLITSLSQNLPYPRLPRDGGRVRVLSVDMGIRNLAYACLDVQSGDLDWTSQGAGGVRSRSVGAGEEKGEAEAEAQGVLDAIARRHDGIVNRVKLVRWDRVGIFDLPDGDSGGSSSIPCSHQTISTSMPSPPPTPSKRKSTAAISAEKNDDATEPEITSKATETFTPATLAPLAHRIITSIFLPLQPTHILIERQRHRSGGGAAVLEWTFRVNMLESMLYAVLTTLRAEYGSRRGKESGNGEFPEVHAMDPKRVGGYWAGMVAAADGGGGGGGGGTAGEGKMLENPRQEKHRKALRIELVEKWFASERLACDAEALATKEQFLSPRLKGRRARKTPKVRGAHDEEEHEDVGAALSGSSKAIKRDDLADALVQGVAFAQWETNRMMVCESLTRRTAASQV